MAAAAPKASPAAGLSSRGEPASRRRLSRWPVSLARAIVQGEFSPLGPDSSRSRRRWLTATGAQARVKSALDLKAISCSRLNVGFSAHSGPSGDDLRRRALRPNATSTVAISNVPFPSIRDVAQTSQMRTVGVWRGGVRCEHIGLPPLSSGGALVARPWLRFHTPSSNRTCRFPASGSRTRPHAFVHGTSCPSRVSRTSPKCP